MRKLLTIALVTALALPGGYAFAHSQTVLDPDDSDGPVDIVATRHAHKPGDRTRSKASFRLVAYESWNYESIDDTYQYVSFEINLDEDQEVDRCLVVRAHTEPSQPGADPALGYSATVYRDCMYWQDELVKSYGTDHVSVPDAHSIRAVVPKRVLLGSGVDEYEWRAVTSFEEGQEGACPIRGPHDGGYGTCSDFTRWKRHRSS